jgi:SpoIID/LytB domain protein
MGRRRRLLAFAAFLALVALGQGQLGAPVRAYPTSAVELQGHGFGHGRGLGQWGGFGYSADHGWTHQQILDHYYGGTAAGSQGDIEMTVQLTKFSGQDLVADSEDGIVFVPQLRPEGQFAVRIHRTAANRFDVSGSDSCGGQWTFIGNVEGPLGVTTNAAPDTGDHKQLLRVCEPDGPQRWLRGTLRVGEVSGNIQTVNVLPIEQYLRGVVPRESPASWGSQGGMAALRAQAVAARSYSTAENRSSFFKTCDTISCQVYGGVKVISGSTVTQLEQPNTDQAINETAGVVRKHSNGNVARTEFSSSTGGYSAGGTFPAVVDDGDVKSPYHDWNASIPVSDIEAAYPAIGTLQSVDITERNGLGDFGGRVLNMVLRGSLSSQNLTGEAFRSKFSLRSNWFNVGSNPATPSERPAVYRGNTWFLRDAAGSGPATSTFVYGDPGDVPLMCDWDGNGSRTPGIFRGGAFFIRNSNTSGPADVSFGFGDSGDTPLCGDWDGDGDDTIAVVRGNEWFLRNDNSTGPHEGHFFYGNVDDVKVAGNWNAPDPYDSPGVVRGHLWYLRDSNFEGNADYVFGFGNDTDKKLVGDWDLAGGDGPGVVRTGQWFLRNAASTGAADVNFSYGNGDDRPLVWR